MASTIEVTSQTASNGNEVLFAVSYDQNHQPTGQPVQLTSDAVSSFSPTLTLLEDGGYVVSYQFVDPSDSSTPYPYQYLGLRSFSPGGAVEVDETIGLNDFNATASIRTIALNGGSFASVVELTASNFGYSTETQSLEFVSADGAIHRTTLFSASGGDGPYPVLVQSDAEIVRQADGRFVVSWSATYTPESPEYPSPTPAPKGSEQFRNVYGSSGELLTSTFIDFSHASDEVRSSITTSLSPSLHNLTLLGSTNISAFGSALDNTLLGNDGKNHLVGNGGDDHLDGGKGTDFLQGGAGSDTFAFSSAIKGQFNSDTLADFTHSVDEIALSRAVFIGLLAGPLVAEQFVDLSQGSETAATRIVYDQHGNLSYDSDGSGATVAIQFATVLNHSALTASDFIIT